MKPNEIVIGSEDSDYVSILPDSEPYADGWFDTTVTVQCDGWRGTFRQDFEKGELSKFAREIEELHKNLIGTAQLEPLEPYIRMTLRGDGKGHISVEGTALKKFESGTRLTFQFTIDQTYLKRVVEALFAADRI